MLGVAKDKLYSPHGLTQNMFIFLSRVIKWRSGLSSPGTPLPFLATLFETQAAKVSTKGSKSVGFM